MFRESGVVHSFKVVGPVLFVFAYEYFVFLGRVTNPSAKSPFLEDQFASLSLASHLRPVGLGKPYQEQKVPGGIARKVIEARKPPYHDKVETIGGDILHSGTKFYVYFCCIYYI